MSRKHSELLSLDTSTDEIQVITNAGITTVTDNTGAIYLLMSNESSNNILHDVQESNVGIITSNTSKSNITSTPTMQIMNAEGIPVSINVNELLSTINTSKELLKDEIPSTSPNILNFPSTSSATNQTSNGCVLQNDNSVPNFPNWALNLHNCTLYGDTYTGYVTDEIEMDNALNQYKKETHSLFAIRQTPSPSKEENIDTVRLMWKSQYVPYDGIPFVNVGKCFLSKYRHR